MLSQNPEFTLVVTVITFDPPFCPLDTLHKSDLRDGVAASWKMFSISMAEWGSPFSECMCSFGEKQYVGFVKSLTSPSLMPLVLIIPPKFFYWLTKVR